MAEAERTAPRRLFTILLEEIILHIHTYIMPDTPQLRFYHPDRPTSIRRGRLPHLEQPGVCAFVTFMMADALPIEARKDRERKKMLWCTHRGLHPHADRHEILDRLGPIHFMKYQRYVSLVYQQALDRGRGSCILAKPENSKLVAEAVFFQHRRRGWLFDFVVMPNHVHLLFQPHPEFSLKSVLDSIRSYSARQINHDLGRKGKFWDREPFDHLVRSMHHFRRYQRYIRANPVKARLAGKQFFLHKSHAEHEGVAHPVYATAHKPGCE